jgi:glycolate oxidase FAD binding subunit
MIANSNLQAATEDLAAICGPEHLRIDEGVVSISPANTDEVSAILRFANENGIAVNPLGSGTKQHWGNLSRPSLVLQTHRLNTVREHTWQDMTCTVEAGCTWSSMQSTLSVHGQFVALDPLWPDHATIGGIIATNDSGYLRLKYGGLRDLVIGMTIVLADGTIARTGGKVVKNVAGYDLHKLMTGAFGTLAVITEVTFRLHSIPKHTQSFTVPSADVAPLGQLLLKVLDSQLSTQSVQLRAGADGFYLDVQLAAMPEVIHHQAQGLAELAQGLDQVVSDSHPNVWNARQELFDRSESFLIKATMLPTDISQFVEAVHALGGTSVTQAVGIMTATIPQTASDQLLQLRQKLEAARGSLTILQQLAETTLDPWGKPPDTLPLMREIKQHFDPNRILNPGRFLGEI